MRVCQVCGAMQSITDTDKRLTTHLEGKLHVGFSKVRKMLKEMLQEQEVFKQRGSRLRTPTPPDYRRE